MTSRTTQRTRRSVRGPVALLVCTAVGDLAVAGIAVASPEVAAVALGTIVTLTTAGVAAAVPLLRPMSA